jgi:ATP-binding cassette, subfamily B, bacterial MsbA
MKLAGSPGRIAAFRRSPGGRLLSDHIRPQLRWLLFAVVCMTVYAGTTAAQAWIMEPMLDQVFLEKDRSMLLVVPLAVVAIALLKGMVDFGQTMALSRVGQRITADLHSVCSATWSAPISASSSSAAQGR